MICTSNIPQIIARLNKWQEGLPGAVGRALAPEYWTGQLKGVARATLQAQAAQWSGELSVGEEAAAAVMGLIQNFVEGVQGFRPGAVTVVTGVWTDANVNLQRVLANQELLLATGQYALDLDQENAERAKQAVADWVAQEKVLSEQDHYDVAEATERVQSILGLIPPPSPAALAGWLASPERRDAAERLTARIQEFLEKSSPSSKVLTPGIVEQWLAAVLLAWREFARVHVRDRLETELNRLTRETAV